MDDAPLLLAQATEPSAAEAPADPNGAGAGAGTADGATGTAESAESFNLLESLDLLHEPEPVLEYLLTLGFLWPAVMAILGLLCILNGYQWHRPIVAFIAFLVGIGLGREIASDMGRPMLFGIAVGLLFAVVATPLLKVTVSLLAGATGAFVGANMFRGLEGTGPYFQPGDEWVGAAVGFVALAMLSLLLFRFVIVLFTSIGGAGLLVFGGVALLMHVEEWRQPVRDSLQTTPLLLPTITLLAAVGGYILQHSRLQAEGVPVFSEQATKKRS